MGNLSVTSPSSLNVFLRLCSFAACCISEAICDQYFSLSLRTECFTNLREFFRGYLGPLRKRRFFSTSPIMMSEIWSLCFLLAWPRACSATSCVRTFCLDHRSSMSVLSVRASTRLLDSSLKSALICGLSSFDTSNWWFLIFFLWVLCLWLNLQMRRKWLELFIHPVSAPL